MITIKIGGSVVNDLHPSVVADIKKVVEEEEVILPNWPFGALRDSPCGP